MTTTPHGGNVVVLDGAGRDDNDWLRRQVAYSRAELAQTSYNGHRLVQHRFPTGDTVRHTGSHGGTAPTRSRRRNDDRNVGNLARLQSKSLRSKSESGSGVGAQTGVKRCRLLLLGVRKQPLSFVLPFGLGRTPCVVLGCALAWCRAWCSSHCTVCINNQGRDAQFKAQPISLGHDILGIMALRKCRWCELSKIII